MKKIQLSQGKFALVDDADFDHLNQWKWYCAGVYAKRSRWDLGKDKKAFMHREIMEASKGMEVDHINHDPLDNRRSNLRLATKSQNGMNRIGKGGKSTSHKGVSKNKYGKWAIALKKGELRVQINNFDTAHQAALAYDLWAVDLFGEFALTNFKALDTPRS